MIDIENEVFTIIADKLRAIYPQIVVVGEDARLSSEFPCVSIVEADNYIYRQSQDSTNNENHAQLMYEINVYSNKTIGKKSECKEILSIIDEELSRLGFTRTMKNPISMDDATIFRLVARYSAVVSKEKIIYRR